MKVLTWNVLHRVHAENYGEPTIHRWHDEPERVRRVVDLLSKSLRVDGFGAALLQEVSGDVLEALRAHLPTWAVLDHPYPRVPRQKQPGAPMRDLSEHLVVVAPEGSTVLSAQTFAGDPGKGVLAVTLPSGLVVASTHVSWGPKGEAQLTTLRELFHASSAPVCIGGDFNAEREVLVRALSAEVVVGALSPGSPRTRPAEDATGGADIDHLLVYRAELRDLRVLDHSELSDHRPVAATVT
ncbi:endonuclease/exonuclease/phosphatase family protein [Archangium lansingense]|uniref:Endonuclease/exonuclease/phosphatase family protein n=1 Tax=Archangium lansingense TaxID=2995310 RepID=A0ABT4AHU2_9BACT|nr:endonuclease/exonuclease/phosphatase family protein [Archangium lansinium]MCY1080469.1 endonuclease/exonuclease/phosphatase family protein [Archangium lansinium]